MEEYQDNGAAVVTRYLLGELAEDEQRRFEEEFMTGARTFEELQAAEDELVDGYVKGALTPRERERFEAYFLATPERRRRLAFARTLHRYVADARLTEVNADGAPEDLSSAAPSSTSEASSDDTSSDEASTDDPTRAPAPSRTSFFRAQTPLVRYAFAALLVLVVSVSALLIFNALRGPRAEGSTLAFTLTPGAVRGASDGGGVKQLDLAPDTGTVELRLVINANAAAQYPRYRANVTNIDQDRPVFSTPEDARPVASPDGTQVVPIRVPAHLLTPGSYKLQLTAAQPDRDFQNHAAYYFTVSRQ